MYVLIYLIHIYVLYVVSSPYLLVFDDDHVCVTREHMMLRVNLVRHRARAWDSLRNYISEFCYFVNFKDFVFVWIIELGFYI